MKIYLLTKEESRCYELKMLSGTIRFSRKSDYLNACRRRVKLLRSMTPIIRKLYSDVYSVYFSYYMSGKVLRGGRFYHACNCFEFLNKCVTDLISEFDHPRLGTEFLYSCILREIKVLHRFIDVPDQFYLAENLLKRLYFSEYQSVKSYDSEILLLDVLNRYRYG